jgi:hypothetical protein
MIVIGICAKLEGERKMPQKQSISAVETNHLTLPANQLNDRAARS